MRYISSPINLRDLQRNMLKSLNELKSLLNKYVINQKVVADQAGQSTVEYMAVMVGFMALCTGLYAIYTACSRGLIGKLIINSASHTLRSDNALGHIADILLF